MFLLGCTGSSPFKKRSTPKCALFMPPMKESPSKMNCKRKRTDSEDIGNFSKLQRSQSVLETSDGSVSKSNVGYIRSHSTLNLSCTRTKLSVHHEKVSCVSCELLWTFKRCFAIGTAD